ncbi:MAG: hypothetical protein AB7H66_04405 [Hyphomonadaceae bacterium]
MRARAPVRLVRNVIVTALLGWGLFVTAAPAGAVPVPEGFASVYFRPTQPSVPADSSGSDPTPVVVPAAPPPQQSYTPPPPTSRPPTAPTVDRQAIPPAPTPAATDVRQHGVTAPRQSERTVEQLLQRRMDPQQYQATMNRVQEMQNRVSAMQSATNAGAGERCCAPSADLFFENAPAAAPGTVAPAGTRAFGLGGGGSAPPVSGSFRPATQQDVQQTTERYDNTIPGGVVLEGAANFAAIERIAYDVRFNAFVLNDNTVYFAPAPPRTIASMCRALQQDQRIGVSLGRVHLVYGAVPANSELALDLKIADHFLGDIVFAGDQWTQGYRFAQGYRPQPHQGEGSNLAVFFKFNGFRFEIADGELRPAGAALDVRLIPLSESPTDNGGHAPDLNALASGQVSQQYQANARHIAENVAYYRNERIVNRMFEYGEVAAFLRGLRAQGYDLAAIAARIEAPIA